MFRKFNEKELELLKKLRKREKVGATHFGAADKRIRYDQQGNFIIAVVKTGGCIYTGVAKFNPYDPTNSKEVGERIALSRALETK